MSREYQVKKENPYLLPDNLYNCVKFAIKDYDRLKDYYNEILYESPSPPDGMPKGSEVGMPTESKVLKRDAIFKQLWCVEQAIMQVPPEYRDAVFSEAKYGGGFPIYASRSCYAKWKQRFVYWTAQNMGLV